MSISEAHAQQVPDSSKILDRIVNTLSDQPLAEALTMSVRVLRETSDHFDWVGIYLVRENDLVLEAFARDEETDHVRIPIGQGICGSAAKEGTTIVVPDVSKDSRYLMCFASTRSEIVVPIKGPNGVLGEIDIDSSRLSAFGQEDREILEEAASILASYLERQHVVSNQPSTR